MGLYADIYAPRRRMTRSGAPEPRLIFLDIQQSACETYFTPRNAIERCRTGHPAQPELVHEVLALALSGGAQPAAIVLDAALVDRRTAPDWPEPGRTAIESRGTSVIYALSGRLAQEPRTIWFDAREDPVKAGLLRENAYAAMAQTFIEAEDGDDVLRRYAPAIVARPADGGMRVLKPTVAAAAAIAAAEGRDGLDRFMAGLLDGRATDCSDHADGHAPRSRYGFENRLICLSALTPDTAGASGTQVPQLLFTLRSLAYPRNASGAGPNAIASSWDDDIEQAAYLRIPVGDVEQLTSQSRSVARFFDKAVIVIGTSALSAGDVHTTPIGTLAGAEVVLNAVRAFLSFPVALHPTLAAELWNEFVLIVLASLMFFLIWCPIGALSHRLPGASWPRAFCLRSMIAIVFVGGIAVIFMVLLYWKVGHSVPKIGDGVPPPDILTPIFAVSLEGFAKAAKWVLDLIHGVVDRILEAVHGWIRIKWIKLKWIRGKWGARSR
ncbi:CHASE2 domain-containing protein [Methylobacterium oryzisoli]|uniref:CHASE2 domain-containing protein n=1 Tax=Methylobacterium oryzisoli TaxID=3385502 RepID=UPI003891A68A